MANKTKATPQKEEAREKGPETNGLFGTAIVRRV
jgi:hypothetical protein